MIPGRKMAPGEPDRLSIDAEPVLSRPSRRNLYRSMKEFRTFAANSSSRVNKCNSSSSELDAKITGNASSISPLEFAELGGFLERPGRVVSHWVSSEEGRRRKEIPPGHHRCDQLIREAERRLD